MKQQLGRKVLVISLAVLIPLWGVEPIPKPSPWQKFKNVFSSKKTDQKDLDQLSEPQKKSFLESILSFKTVASKFNAFSKQQIKMITVKVKTLELVQERLYKISKGQSFLSKLFWKEKSPTPEIEQEKINLAGQLGRLRADLFLTFVEIFQEIRQPLMSVKEMLQRGLFKNITIFDTMIKATNDLITQGNTIGEKLLRASDAYGKKDSIDTINKNVEVLISNYIKSAVKVLSMVQPAVNFLKGALNLVRSAAWVFNTVSFGSITAYTLVLELFDKILNAGKIAADLSKDIFTQVVERNGIKGAESKLASLEKELDRTSKKVEASDSQNDEDVLNLDDLRQKK